MEDLKVTVEIKNSLGNGVGYEYDLDVIHPYLDQLLSILSEAEVAQNCKEHVKFFDNLYSKIMVEVNKKELKPKAKNRKKTAKEELGEMHKEADDLGKNNELKIANGIYKTNKITVNTPIRDSKGRFSNKKNEFTIEEYEQKIKDLYKEIINYQCEIEKEEMGFNRDSKGRFQPSFKKTYEILINDLKVEIKKLQGEMKNFKKK